MAKTEKRNTRGDFLPELAVTPYRSEKNGRLGSARQLLTSALNHSSKRQAGASVTNQLVLLASMVRRSAATHRETASRVQASGSRTARSAVDKGRTDSYPSMTCPAVAAGSTTSIIWYSKADRQFTHCRVVTTVTKIQQAADPAVLDTDVFRVAIAVDKLPGKRLQDRRQLSPQTDQTPSSIARDVLDR